MKQPASSFYAVIRERGEAWDRHLPMRQQVMWDEHAAFMDALADEGFIVLGGPLGDGEKILLIVAAASPDQIAMRLAEDPWVPLGLLRLVTVEPWEILLGKQGIARDSNQPASRA